jgi:hypothetical protein
LIHFEAGFYPFIICTICERRRIRKHRDRWIVTNQEEDKMKRMSCITIGLLAVAFTLAGCAHLMNSSGWVTLIDGEKGLENWNQVGGANWRAEGGAIVADKSTTKGSSFLVTKNSYKDFELRVEFYAETNTNSGVFIRCSDPQKIGSATAYEVNIWDARPDPSYGTGGIVNVAKVSVAHKAGGKWSTFVITAKGPEMNVVLNGVVTVNVRNSKFAEGPIALQYSAGPIKFRKVQVRPL